MLAGCMGSATSLPVYDSTQIGQVISEQRGEILAVRDVLIKAPTGRAGSAGAGSRIGAATAAAAITGSPVAAASAAASVLGGVAGSRADDRMGEELTIQLEGGQTILVVQERGRTPLAAGERVKVRTGTGSSASGGANTQVVRDESLQYAQLSAP
jgi:outer membrane lipoprotein SlyB